mmetsp:Transcript_6888/g.6192  ORF Transcript_6888/g.6192 Transcript_6888/m.6192 type:complete len:264 (-) Transcript_6888:14-805(-)
MAFKTCYFCEESQPKAEFKGNLNETVKSKIVCTICNKIRSICYKEKVTAKKDSEYMKKMIKQYQNENLKSKLCMSCGSNHILCLDHLHGKTEIRGILCSNCNVSLGNMAEDPVAIIKLASYALDMILKNKSAFIPKSNTLRELGDALSSVTDRLSSLNLSNCFPISSSTTNNNAPTHQPSQNSRSPLTSTNLITTFQSINIQDNRSSYFKNVSLSYTVQCCARTAQGKRCLRYTRDLIDCQPRCNSHENTVKFKQYQQFPIAF